MEPTMVVQVREAGGARGCKQDARSQQAPDDAWALGETPACGGWRSRPAQAASEDIWGQVTRRTRKRKRPESWWSLARNVWVPTRPDNVNGV